MCICYITLIAQGRDVFREEADLVFVRKAHHRDLLVIPVNAGSELLV